MPADITIQAEVPRDTAATLALGVRNRIFLYLGVLITLLAFGSPAGGLIDIPVSFVLKNKLHLEARELAMFRLGAALPLYFSFVFGFIRDMWNPFGLKDRGFIMLFGGICAALYAGFAFVPPTYWTLLAANFLLATAFLFVSSAQNGLASVIGQQHSVTGGVSTVWNIAIAFPTVAALLAGGLLSQALETMGADLGIRILFLAGAAVMACVALYGAMKPASVYGNIRPEQAEAPRPLSDLKRLARHWPIYPALLIWLLWNFAPGSGTPLQYYLQNTLHAGDDQWGLWNAIFSASFVPAFLAYGVLCRSVPLKSLLLWGTIVAVPQLVPLLFINSVTGALVAAVPIGLMGGGATAAYMDLIIRSCPKGLQGTTLMLSASAGAIAIRFGDVLGTDLYSRFGGFTVCVIAITVAYAAILPLLLLIPKELVASVDA